MIKLNNRNITYVALADSNNSLKAPKEIWYADSNNSVKLVYRRKDALIEGEDYEKYHWILTDTGNPYIQVDDTCNTDENAYIETRYKCNYSNVGFDMIIGFSINQNNNIGIRIFNAYNKTFVDRHKIVNGVLSSSRIMKSQSNINAERYIKATFNNLIIDTTEYQSINWGSGFDAIDKRGTILYTNQGNNDVHYAETKLRVNNVEYDLTPCKLLKPVPKWLDANGIRRQIGECGMIDLVSGKFYGNVNSVGTFTVENYYERKEWLVGDGSAVINTNIEDITNLTELYCYFYSNNPSNNERIFGREGSSRIVLRYTSVNHLEFFTSPNNNPQYITLRFNTEGYFYADFIANQASTSLSNPTNFIGNSNKIGNRGTIHLFGDNAESEPTSIVSAKIKSFIAAPFMNLIPCTLTMDLPASMDANNIARTKGTSGMWDLVSDKFYGNVASSGTFKAVNLAEGVDYEVHQWLVGDGSAYIKIKGYTRNEYWTIRTKCRVRGAGVSNQYPQIYGATYYNNIYGAWSLFSYPDIMAILMRSSSTSSYSDISFSYNYNDVVSITDEHNSVTVNNITKSTIANRVYFDTDEFWLFSAFDNRYTTNPASRIANADISQFTIAANGITVLDLVPCRLLRPIPAALDANGIARQAGECGMYDTVNDVFYGNVASSGSFSCVNDS